MSEPAPRGGYPGPWSDLPPADPKPARSKSFPMRREPILKARTGGREPFIRNWKGLLIILFLLFVAPPLCAWIGHLIMSAVQGG